MEKIISFIIPLYNSKNTILRCLEPFNKYHSNDIEVILVDDESTDGTFEFIIPLIQFNPIFKYYKKKNSGAGLSRQFGIERALGEYIMFIDSDDYLLPDSIQYIIKLIEKNKCDFYTFNYFIKYENRVERKVLFNQENKLLKAEEKENYIEKFWGPDSKNRNGIRSIWNCIFSSKNIKKCKFESERKIFSEDTAFLVFYTKDIEDIYISTKIIYCHTDNLNSLSYRYLNDDTIQMITNLLFYQMDLLSFCGGNIENKKNNAYRLYLENCSTVIKNAILTRKTFKSDALIKNSLLKHVMSLNLMNNYPKKTKIFWYLALKRKYNLLYYLIRGRKHDKNKKRVKKDS